MEPGAGDRIQDLKLAGLLAVLYRPRGPGSFERAPLKGDIRAL